MPERATSRLARRSEESAEAVVVGDVASMPPLVDEGPNEQESESLMDLDDTRPQMSAQAGLATGSRGEAPRARRSEEASSAAREKDGSGLRLAMAAVVDGGCAMLRSIAASRTLSLSAWKISRAVAFSSCPEAESCDVRFAALRAAMRPELSPS